MELAHSASCRWIRRGLLVPVVRGSRNRANGFISCNGPHPAATREVNVVGRSPIPPGGPHEVLYISFVLVSAIYEVGEGGMPERAFPAGLVVELSWCDAQGDRSPIVVLLVSSPMIDRLRVH